MCKISKTFNAESGYFLVKNAESAFQQFTPFLKWLLSESTVVLSI